MIRLALRVRRDDAELVLADLLELAPSGVEEIELPAEDGGEPSMEYVVYGAPGELPQLPDLQAVAGKALVEISTSEIPDDWSERWKRFHSPVLIELPRGSHTRAVDGRAAPALHVRPPWAPATAHTRAHEIVIDPAQAFGTGAHATTRMCLELLLELTGLDEAREAVLDVGSGSGVLAIAAVKLGYSPVIALDNDRESIAAIADNAGANGAEVDARHFDLRRETLPTIDSTTSVSIMFANLLKPLLYDLSAILFTPPTHLIASGLLCVEADEIASEFAARHGLRERRRLERREWAALWLTRD
jgi:ribosomal protein L11 methyltransferase